MKSKVVSPVAVDLGAKFTGVLMFHDIQAGNPEDLRASVLVMPQDGGKITWSQAGRRQRRHQQRNIKRRRLAKRLLRLVLAEVAGRPLTIEEEDAVSGLLNRRGYNRVEAEIDWALLEGVSPDWHADRFPRWFNNEESLAEQFSRMIQDVELLKELRSSEVDFWRPVREVKKDIKKFFDEDDPEVLKAHKTMTDAIEGILKSIETGARHRREYLSNIKKEIIKDVRLHDLAEAIGSKELLHSIIGHISNFQLRVLRWYFNDPRMKNGDWMDHRLFKLMRRWIERWRVHDDEERRRRRHLLQWLDSILGSSTLEEHSMKELIKGLAAEIPPDETIPPYEDMNNRRPPKDRTVWLDPRAMTREFGEDWRTWADSLMAAESNMPWQEGLSEAAGRLDRKSRLGGSEVPQKDYERCLFLQRLLDRSQILDHYKLRLLARTASSQEAEDAKALLARDLGLHILDDFLWFCSLYYEEISRVRAGAWTPDTAILFERSDLHPPRKQKILYRLVGQALGMANLTEEKFEGFLEEVWRKRHGRTTVRAMCEKVEKARKKFGNLFDALLMTAETLQRRGQKLEKKSQEYEALKAAERGSEAARIIADYFGHGSEERAYYDNPFTMAQLYTIIERDRHGFSRASLAAHLENSWRMEKMEGPGGIRAARCSRLSADTVRPFDGILQRVIERQAIEVARIKTEQIKAHLSQGEFVEVPIIVEENSFSFTIGLKEIKGTPKKEREKLQELLLRQQGQWLDKIERIKKASKGICAYTGNPIGEHGEIDHILPRAFSQGHHGTVFNSEGNLIWVSIQGNRTKRARRYYLKDLAPAYLEALFGTNDVNVIAQRIEAEVEALDELPFEARSPEEQMVLRHALFLPESSKAFQKAFAMLATRMKSRVSGTQAWFARTLAQFMKRELSRKGLDPSTLSFSIHRVSAEQVSQVRKTLGDNVVRLAKSDVQGIASHAVDALCALAVAAEETSSLEPYLSGISESPDRLSELFPENVEVKWIERLKPYAPQKDISSMPLFKEGLYAEHFLPLWWSDRGIWVGFSARNRVRLEGKEPELLIQKLKRWIKGSVPSQPPKGQPICLKIDQEAALGLLHRAAKDGLDDQEEKEAAELLLNLRYVTVKEKIQNKLCDNNGRLISEKSFEKLKAQGFKISLPRISYPKRSRRPQFLIPKTSLYLPTRDDWQRIYDCVRKESVEGRWSDNQWRELGKLLFNPGSRRPHRKARQEFSLPVIATASGAFRVKRKGPRGALYQLMVIGDYAISGFPVNEGGIQWKKPALMPFLRTSPNISKADALEPELQYDKIVPLDHWCRLDAEDLELFDEVWACPGTKDRMYVRLRHAMGDFLAMVEMADLGLSQIPAEIKLPQEQKKIFSNYLKWIGKPRSSLFMLQVGRSAEYWFIVESTSAQLRSRYEEAWRKENML